ncbi:MAG: hypothetical protein QM622_05860 [Microbacterium sp.]
MTEGTPPVLPMILTQSEVAELLKIPCIHGEAPFDREPVGIHIYGDDPGDRYTIATPLASRWGEVRVGAGRGGCRDSRVPPPSGTARRQRMALPM